MKLETKFQKAFFFPFLIGTTVTVSVVLVLLFLYSFKHLSESSKKNSEKAEKDYSISNLYAINNQLNGFIATVQLKLEEIINSYLTLATHNTLLDSNFEESKVFNGYTLNGQLTNEEKLGFWFVSQNITHFDNLTESGKKQLIIFSNIVENLYDILGKNNNDVISFLYFMFNTTEIFAAFPLSHSNNKDNKGLISKFKSFENPSWCKKNDIHGVPNYYYFKCRDFYVSLFDLMQKNPEQQLFVLSPYKSVDGNLEFSQCIKFIDPIDNETAFLCADNIPTRLFQSFDRINNEIRGHYLITVINNEKPFYFPYILHGNSNTPISRYEYKETDNYYLQELINFTNFTEPRMNKNLGDISNLIDKSIFGVLPNISESNHSFTKNKIKYNYEIIPFAHRYKGDLFHLLNIIYVYEKNLFYQHLFLYQEGFELKLYLAIFLFIFFGITMIVLIWSTMVALAKYIVIPIKNVQYMLKGINIGGENRLEYLESLKSKQDNELNESKTKNVGSTFYMKEEDNCLFNNQNNNEPTNSSNSGEDGNNGSSQNNNLLNGAKTDENEDNNGDMIEKELHFYDFDEELLQDRPREINGLVNVLLDLKKVLILTSTANDDIKGKEKIIDYSTSQNIFENVKNKEGSFICQSNIGNISSLCEYYDKAIYHLCLSLQIPKLKKFLSKTLNDELDVSGSLLHLIDSQYNKNFPKEITNQLVKKQQNSSHKTYSQKAVGDLINNRYNKLIQIYFSFFSKLKKSKRQYEDLSGLYLNSQFHTISYFNKILIQYVYLCYVSNDLIKIGESILDYIEFLLKYKLSTKNQKEILNKNLYSIPYYKNIQDIKLKAFDKVNQWFGLFEHYISHVNENTTLGNDKSIIDTYLNNGGTSMESSSNQSAFQFKIHIQRGNFLKGKFALICKDYYDAVYYFVNASKKDLLVFDGLIKKRALEHLQKLVIKLETKIKKNYQYYGANMNTRNTNNLNNYYTYLAEITNTKDEIDKDLSFLRVKRSKDIIVIIDRGHIEENSDYESYVDEAKNIVKNYIGMTDRFGMFVFDWKYRVICPIKGRQNIDFNQISSYINSYSNDYINNNYDQISNGMKNEEVIFSLNYCINYLLVKMVENNEKFFIYFTNVFQIEENFKIFEKMKKEKNVNFLIVGKFYEGFEITPDISELLEECGKKSEFIDFTNMKRIKNILSCSNTINDPITFPNEIYESSSK